MELQHWRLRIAVANAIIVWSVSVALYVFDWGIHPDTVAERFAKAFGLFWIPTLLVLPVIAIAVGWRAARDTTRFHLGLVNTVWRPTLEGCAFGFAFGFLAFANSAATGSGHDMIRPAAAGEWATALKGGIRIASVLAVVTGFGALCLAIGNRLFWRFAVVRSEHDRSA